MKHTVITLIFLLTSIVSGCSSESQMVGETTDVVASTATQTRQFTNTSTSTSTEVPTLKPTSTLTQTPTSAPISTPTSTPTLKPKITPTLAAQENTAESPGFKIKTAFSADSEQVLAEEQVLFLDNRAVVMQSSSNEAAVVFDLLTMSWREMDSGTVVRLSDCKAWAEASAQMTEASLSQLPDGMEKRFGESLLHPNFEIETTEDGKLVLKNEFLIYEISSSQPVSGDQISQFFAYDRLNAYRKAILERKFPPFSQLAVSEELEARGLFPNETEMTMKTPQGDLVVYVSVVVEEMTESERELVKLLLKE